MEESSISDEKADYLLSYKVLNPLTLENLNGPFSGVSTSVRGISNILLILKIIYPNTTLFLELKFAIYCVCGY